MKTNKIAAGIIIKNDDEADSLEKCLNSVAPFVDGVYITVTQEPYQKIEEIVKRYGVNLDIQAGKFNHIVTRQEYEWIKNYFSRLDSGWGEPKIKEGTVVFEFSQARNANIDSIPDEYDWFFWIDTDDVLLEGKRLRASAETAKIKGYEAVIYNYIYEAELDLVGGIKNVIIQHLRERLVRIDGEYRKIFKWIGNIHETIIQQRETKKSEDKTIQVLHLSSRKRMIDAVQRNIRVLEYDIYKTKGKDPRPIYYLGKTYFDFHNDDSYKKAEQLIYQYLSPEKHESNMSGWKQERSQAWEYLGEIYRFRKEFNNSIKALHNALIEYAQLPSIYLSLAVSYMLKEEYDTARFWAIIGSKVPKERTTLVSNPRDIESRAYEVIYNAGIKTNRINEAWAACQGLKELYPNDPAIEKQWQFINETRSIRDQLKRFGETVNFLSKTNQQNKIRPLLASVPDQLKDNPYVRNLENQMFPPKDWRDNEIAFYCGEQFTMWSPKHLKKNGQEFIGGSEESVIYLSRELEKQGLKPVVYCNPEKEGVYNGVEFLSHFKFNPRDNFNFVIFWRSIGYSDMNVTAKKQYLWSHDVLNPVEFTKERIDRLTKIIVLSKAHRSCLHDIPDNEFLLSSNGYYEHNPDEKLKNNPKWCIWTSSYDRGLQNLLEIWPDVIKQVPDAQLHVFYGWKLFKHFYRNNPERMAWAIKIEKMLNGKGIVHHDRVSQSEIESWYKKCGLFTYPSHFFEINCISAIKAQTWGAVPVVSNHAALSETVQFGKKIDGEIYENFALSPQMKEVYKKELIAALKDEKWQKVQREKMIPWARKKYSWQKVAEQWRRELMS